MSFQLQIPCGKAREEKMRAYKRNWYREHRPHPEIPLRGYVWRGSRKAVWLAYLQRIKERRLKVIANLGGQCSICGSQYRLELHHKIYGDEGRKDGWNAWRRTVEEAEFHPDNFLVLCHFCHKVVTLFSLDKTRWIKLKALVEGD